MTEIGHILNLLVVRIYWKCKYDQNWAYLWLEIHRIVPDQYVRCKYDQDWAHFGSIGHWDMLEIF